MGVMPTQQREDSRLLPWTQNFMILHSVKTFFRIFSTSIWLLPFLYLNSAIDPALTPRLLALSIAFLIAIITVLMYRIRGEDGLDYSILLYGAFPLALGYVVVSTLALTQAGNIAEGVFDISRTVVALAALGILSLAFVLDESLPRFVARAQTLAGTGLAIIAISQFFHLGFEGIPGNHIPYATMANKNLLSSALFLILPGMLFNWVRASGLERWLSLNSISLVGYVLLISQTRSVWLAIICSGILTGFLALKLGGPGLFGKIDFSGLRRAALPAASAAAVVLLLSGATALYYDAGELPTVKKTLVNTDTASLKVRIALWEKSVRMFRDRPALGHGPGNWKLAAQHYGPQNPGSETDETIYLRPHNDFLWVLTESGVVGAGLYLSVFLVALYYGAKTIRANPNAEKRLLATLMVFGIIGFLVISFFSFPRERMFHLLGVMSMIAMLQSMYHTTGSARKRPPRTLVFAGLSLGAVCLILCAVVGWFRLKAETHIQRALAATSQRNWEVVISETRQAESVFVQFDPATNPLAWYRGVAYLSLNNSEEALKSFQLAYEHNPRHVQTLNGLGLCYEAKGNHRSALEFYRQSLVLSLRDETIMNLAAVCYNLGDFRDAHSYLMRVKEPGHHTRFQRLVREVTRKLDETSPSESAF